MSELKRCPHCSGESDVRKRYIGYGSLGLGAHDWYSVGCTECHATTKEYATEEASAAALNRRTPEPISPPQALSLEELRERDGKPVWVKTLENPGDNPPYWAIVDKVGYRSYGVNLISHIDNDFGGYELYGKTWLAYDREPKEDA